MYLNGVDLDEWGSYGFQQIPASILRFGTDERDSNSRLEAKRKLGLYCAQALKPGNFDIATCNSWPFSGQRKFYRDRRLDINYIVVGFIATCKVYLYIYSAMTLWRGLALSAIEYIPVFGLLLI